MAKKRILLVDGDNLMHQLVEARVALEAGKLSEARSLTVLSLHSQVPSYTHIEVHFDGFPVHLTSVPGIHVHFSGNHSADTLIQQRLKTNKHAFHVLSNDKEIREAAKRANATLSISSVKKPIDPKEWNSKEGFRSEKETGLSDKEAATMAKLWALRNEYT